MITLPAGFIALTLLDTPTPTAMRADKIIAMNPCHNHCAIAVEGLDYEIEVNESCETVAKKMLETKK